MTCRLSKSAEMLLKSPSYPKSIAWPAGERSVCLSKRFSPLLRNRTKYEYDALGRRTAVIAPAVVVDGVTLRLRSETTYDSQGRVASEITNLRQLANGTIDRTHAQTTIPTYDHFGNVISSTMTALDGAGHSQSVTTSATYDDKGRKLSETDAVNGTKDFIYDSQGRLVEVRLPAVYDPDEITVPARPTYVYAYDARGNQTLIVDPNGRETRFTYDEQGRQLSRTLPLGFGADGILGTGDDSAVTSGDFTETFEYDDRGRQILHVSFEGKVTENVYSTDTGRLSEQRFFDNLTAFAAEDPHVTVERQFDALGRDVEVSLVDHVDSSNDRTGSRTFGALGRISSESGPEGTIRYEYDTFGRITRTFTGSDTNDPENDFRRTYDAFGRLDKITVWERNDVPLPGNAREITDYDYDLLGNVAKVTKPNGVIETYQYDELARLESLVNYAPDGTPNTLTDNPKIAQYDYTYRKDGKKESETTTVWESGVLRTSSYEWSYDENGRLTDEVFNSYDELLSQTSYFTLDLAGNRLEQNLDLGNDATIDKTTEYTYDANDRLEMETTGDVVSTYAYDHTQQSTKTVTENSIVQSVVTMGWSVRGLMESVTVESYSSGSISKREKLSYAYDDEGIRFSVLTETDATANSSFESRIQTKYLVDRRNLTGYQQNLVETTANADTGAEISKTIYTFGPQIISQTKFDAVNPNGVTQVLQLDRHGSTRMLLSMAAAIVQSFRYDAYGNAIGFDPKQTQTNRLYDAEVYNAISDSIYLRGREYGPSIARLYGLDPFTGDTFNPISFNKYLFGNSDGANNIDPDGRMSVAAGIALGGLIGSMALLMVRHSIGQPNNWINWDLRSGVLNHTMHSIALTFPQGTNMTQVLDNVYLNLKDFVLFNDGHNSTADLRIQVDNGVKYGYFNPKGILDFELSLFGTLVDVNNPTDVPIRLSSDISDRRVTADTLGYHMLAAQRQWWVTQTGPLTIKIHTESYDYPRGQWNRMGMNILGESNQMAVWEQYLMNIRDHYVNNWGASGPLEPYRYQKYLPGVESPWQPLDPYPGIESP